MKDKIGSIVAIEPETGEILCMVSSPTFDPHLMIGRQRGKNHLMLQRDFQKPLLNRALDGCLSSRIYFQGSTGIDLFGRGNYSGKYTRLSLSAWV